MSRYNRITYQQGFGFPHCCHAFASRDMAEKQKELKTSFTKQGEGLTAQLNAAQESISSDDWAMRTLANAMSMTGASTIQFIESGTVCLSAYLSVSLSDVSVKLALTTKLTKRWAKRLATQLVNGLLTLIVSSKRRGGR